MVTVAVDLRRDQLDAQRRRRPATVNRRLFARLDDAEDLGNQTLVEESSERLALGAAG
jgi:hypothetical protein